MQPYKLPRTGNAPLVFTGEELAEETGEIYAGQQQNRYHNLALYATSKDQYILHVAYRTSWEGEHDTDRAEVFPAIRDAVLHLQRFDPLRDLQGFPPGAQFAERQQRLEHSLRVRFFSQVRDLLKNVEGAEEIEEIAQPEPTWLNHLNALRHEVERKREAKELSDDEAHDLLDLLAQVEERMGE
jgi:hypothetical protein